MLEGEWSTPSAWVLNTTTTATATATTTTTTTVFTQI